MELRDFISALEKSKDLVRINESLSTKYEISAVVDIVDKRSGQAVIFENVEGYNSPIVGNLLSKHRRAALAMGVEERLLVQEYMKRIESKVKPRIVSDGPVRERVIQNEVDIIKEIPVLTHHERDIGPYFTSGVVMAKDPETGVRGMGIHRIQLRSANEISLNLATPPVATFLKKAKDNQKELEIAVVIGVDPLTFIASVFFSPGGVDKFEIAGALRGSPVDLVKCSTVDLEVPAQSEFVLEGRIDPTNMVGEGPFGESWGTYIETRNPLCKVQAINSRHEPIYHALTSFSGEEVMLRGLSMVSDTLPTLQEKFPEVGTMWIDPFNRSSLIVQIEKRREETAKKILEHILSTIPFVNSAIIVDADIDLLDPYAIGFAISTRHKPQSGTMILEGLRGFSLIPSSEMKEGTGPVTSKLGIDATKPLIDSEKYDMVKVPRAAATKASELVKKYLD
ncbi:MAG: UbiD family decarboxylase [Nitrososphaerales archaeon]